MIKIEKNIYDPPEKSDGRRILVMRLWPRGISKDKVDLWMKELGTEPELIRKWKDGNISWSKFKASYLKGLAVQSEPLRSLAKEAKKKTVSLLCSCQNPERCHRSLLKKALEKL